MIGNVLPVSDTKIVCALDQQQLLVCTPIGIKDRERMLLLLVCPMETVKTGKKNIFSSFLTVMNDSKKENIGLCFLLFFNTFAHLNISPSKRRSCLDQTFLGCTHALRVLRGFSTYHDPVIVPVLVLSQLGTCAEAAHTEIKVAAHGAPYPDRVGNVSAAWVAMIFNTRLGY